MIAPIGSLTRTPTLLRIDCRGLSSNSERPTGLSGFLLRAMPLRGPLRRSLLGASVLLARMAVRLWD